jgi:hypothetical protein
VTVPYPAAPRTAPLNPVARRGAANDPRRNASIAAGGG